MKRLSIIVPIFKVEDYLERCIRSLENQDLQHEDYEIICINDGSPDNCREIIMALKEEYSNIILIDQENQGVSIARNNGINIASGKYIVMIDPDDFIKTNSINEKLTYIEENDWDIAYTGYIILNERMVECYQYDILVDQTNILNGVEYFKKYEQGRSEIRDPHRSVAIFLKTDFLNAHGLRYLDGIPFLEDGEFMTRVNCLANRVSFLNNPFYLRTTRPGSATHSRLYFSEKAREGFIRAAQNLLDFKYCFCQSKEQKVFMNQPIIHFVVLYITSLSLYNYLKSFPDLTRKLRESKFLVLDIEGCSKAYTDMAKRYNYSLTWFYLNWRIKGLIKSINLKVKGHL